MNDRRDWRRNALAASLSDPRTQGSPALVAAAHRDLGRLDLDDQDWNQAVAHLTVALEIFTHERAVTEVVPILLERARAAVWLGDTAGAAADVARADELQKAAPAQTAAEATRGPWPAFADSMRSVAPALAAHADGVVGRAEPDIADDRGLVEHARRLSKAHEPFDDDLVDALDELAHRPGADPVLAGAAARLLALEAHRADEIGLRAEFFALGRMLLGGSDGMIELATLQRDEAACLHTDGRIAEAITTMTSAAELAVRAANAELAGMCLGWLGEIYVGEQRWEEALDHLRRAERWHRRAGAGELAVAAVSDQAVALFGMGRRPEAVELWSAAVDQAVAVGAKSRLPIILENFHNGLVDHGDLVRAREIAAVRAALSGGDDRERTWSRLTSEVECDPGSVDEEEIDRLIHASAVAADPALVVRSLVTKGMLRFRRGDLAGARTVLRDAAAHASGPALHFLATIHFNLAGVEREAGNFAEAERLAERAETNFRRHHDEWGVRAVRQLRRENSLGSTVPDGRDITAEPAGPPIDRMAAMALTASAAVDVTFQRWESARRRYTAALEFFTGQGYRRECQLCELALAAIDCHTNQAARAEDRCRSVLSITGDDPMMIADAEFTLAVVRERRQDPASAIRFFASAGARFVAMGAPARAAVCALNGGVLEIQSGEIDRGLVLVGQASETMWRRGMFESAARADLAAALALRAMNNHRFAFDVLAPALLTLDLLRARLTRPGDRQSWRQVYSWAVELAMDVAHQVGDPRLIAEMIERLRLNGWPVETRDQAPIDADVLRVSLSPAGFESTESASAGDELRVEEPPLLRMPWGIAWEPYERVARQRIGVAAVAVVTWDRQMRGESEL